MELHESQNSYIYVSFTSPHKETNTFSIIINELPFEGNLALRLNKLESPSPNTACAKIGWNQPIRSREVKNVKNKFTGGRTDRYTDGRRT